MTQELGLRLSRFIQKHGLAGAKLVVAVSGGPDSVCLLHILAGLKDELGLKLHVTHLDHQLRGAESRGDAEYVSALSERLGVPVTLGQADVKAYQKAKRLSLEEAAREVRYRFLAELAQSLGAHFIATGHTRNDHVETILMHIVRGSGTRGLIGLKPLTDMTLSGQKVTIVRPLLGVTREETSDYCQQHDLNPRLDASNLTLSLLRNRVRQKLLPMLQSYNPRVTESLMRLAGTAADETDFLDGHVAVLWGSVAQRRDEVIILHKKALRELHPALQRQLLRSCLENLLGSLKDIEVRHIEEVRVTLNKPAGRQINLPYGLVFVVGYDRYWLGKESSVPCPFPPLEGEFTLNIPGVTELSGWQVDATVVDNAFGKEDARGVLAYFDLDKIGPNLSIRDWQRGDRFQPLGLGGEKKLGEFMIDAKIPRTWRQHIPVVTSPEHIVWLVGYRIDERVKVADKTKRVLRLEFKRI